MLNEDQIKHIAHLARLGLSDEEIKKYTRELGEILGYFEKLNELDVKNAEQVAQITGLENITRVDEAKPSDIADSLLECSSNEIQDHHIKVKNVF